MKRDRLVVRPPPESAAGAVSVAVALKSVAGQAGLGAAARVLGQVNQKAGFDCPGCAWADPLGARKAAEFCENGAKAIADEATRARVTPRFFRRHPVSELRARSGRWLNAQGRITHPMLLEPGSDHYQPLSWPAAIELIAERLKGLDHPDQAAFYTSGRTSNEAAFLYQLLVRRFGTNNLPDCSNMCHESSGVALTEVLGSGKGSVSLEDFTRAEAIFLLGQNPGSNHPRMLATLQEAKRAGATLVSVNPLEETGLRRYRNPQEVSGYLTRGTPLADLTLRVRVNGDAALLQGLMKAMHELAEAGRGTLDLDFIDRYCSGYDALDKALEATPWSAIVEASGVPREQIEAAAAIALESEATIACWAMGITQHVNAVATIQQIVNFLLLKGNLGKPGAGACPVRGHSNVQGDRTMGIWERPSPALLDALEQTFGFSMPREPGVNTVETIEAAHRGHLRVFFAMGGNFVAAAPDLEHTAAAMAHCDLTVQVSTKLNHSHLHTGHRALILPALGRTEIDRQGGVEQFITTENSMGVVQPSRGVLEPAAETLKSEVRIVAELGRALFGDGDPVDWSGLAEDYGRIRDLIAATLPGFEDLNDQMADPGYKVLPHAVRDERRFATADGRAGFTVHDIEPLRAGPGQLMMTTLRTHDQFNTTVYSNDDRYRGIQGSRRILFVHPDDLEELGLVARQPVRITSHLPAGERSLEGFRVVPYDIPRGCAASYYPETNALVPFGHHAEGSMTPAYKSVPVSLQPM